MPLFSQRRNTDASGSSLRTRAPPPSREPTISLRRYGTEPVPKSNQKPNMEQYKYPVYRLHWDKLKAILQQWFPDTEFRELRTVQKDMYLIEVPEALTSSQLRFLDAESDSVPEDPQRNEDVLEGPGN